MVADMVICGIELPFIIYGTVLGRWDLPYILCSLIGVLLYFAAGTSLRLSVVIPLIDFWDVFQKAECVRDFPKLKRPQEIWQFHILSMLYAGRLILYISTSYIVRSSSLGDKVSKME